MSQTETDAQAVAARAAATSTHSAAYRYYVLGVLFLTYAVNVMDRGVLGVLLESIKHEFALNDLQIGFLSSLPFAFFYATLGIPIAALADRTIRRNVLAACCALWSLATAACGLAVNFGTLLAGRALTGVGEAGGTPPSHSLISDYFSRATRATALSIYALGVPLGTMLGNFIAGRGNDHFGWRTTFILAGLPGLVTALLVWLTIREPPRGMAELGPRQTKVPAPPLGEGLRFLWSYPSFRHMCVAAGLHSVVWYAGSQLNGSFFRRVHEMSAQDAGDWLALFALLGSIGTFLGGLLADRLATRNNDRRWYMWVPGIATLVMVPLQFSSYLSGNLTVVIPSFVFMTILASMFFGPSFAVSQLVGTLRTRALATSVLLFVQTFVGLGLGPLVAGALSNSMAASIGESASLRYALVIVGLANIWATAHYMIGARTIRENIAKTEALNRAEVV
ncbi:MAG TPA: MFS transporter [Steroidobacteraceae bacterium]|jgi:MFS family permease|nr:MFS transporter [Steroidobacteraceae bacterium]